MSEFNISTREDLVLKLQDFSSYIVYDAANLDDVKQSEEFENYIDGIKTAIEELCPDEAEEKFNAIIEMFEDIESFNSDEFEASVSEICRDIEAISYWHSNDNVVEGIYVDPEVDVHFVATGDKQNVSPALSPLSKIPNIPLTELKINPTTLIDLKEDNINTLRELLVYDINELEQKNYSKKTLVELIYRLDEKGYRLKGCEQEKYDTIDNYIAENFTCDRCGHKLDPSYLSATKLMCHKCIIAEMTKSLSEIRANKTEYIGKYLHIEDEIQLTYNQCARQAFYGTSHGEQIELFYDRCKIAEELLMLVPHGNKVKVSGVVRKYSNTDDIYVNVDKIEGLDDELELIENLRILHLNDSKDIYSLRDILAYPNKYKDKFVKIREQLTVKKNNHDTQIITAHISTGKALHEYEVYNSIDIFTSSETKSTDDLHFEPNYEKIQVDGIIRINEASSKPYIEAKSIYFVQKFSLPEVSIKMVLAYPKRYAGKKIKILEKLVVYSNNAKRKSFKVYQSLGPGRFEYNSENNIEVFYEKAKQIDGCIMIDPDYQKITVEGYLYKYNNSEDYYIDGTNITADFLK